MREKQLVLSALNSEQRMVILILTEIIDN